MQEIWKSINSYEGLYEISNKGRIKSLNYNHQLKPKILSPSINGSGYFKVELYKNNKSKIHYIHRLVAETFIDNTNNYPCVNHKDGNKTNNIVSNLEWVTHSQNTIHAYKTGLTTSPFKGRYGKDSFSAKPVLQYDKNGNFIKRWESQSDAARFYNIRPNCICQCVIGKQKTTHGFIWKRPID